MAPRVQLLERAVRENLGGLRIGSLTMQTPLGADTYGDAHGADAHGVVHVGTTTGSGTRTAGAGAWAPVRPTPDYCSGQDCGMIVRVFADQSCSASMPCVCEFRPTSRPVLKAYHALQDNTRRGAAKNISAHYDLSNEFFGLFLDPSMTYSSAVFEELSLCLCQTAQHAKIDRLCERLRLGPSGPSLEIGTGWGAFAIRAAERFGCKVTTTTISRQQHDFARERVEGGQVSRIGSNSSSRTTGTCEARSRRPSPSRWSETVGARHYRSYFSNIGRLLAPGGAFACQAITIHDRHFERAQTEDFIQRHIFPGTHPLGERPHGCGPRGQRHATRAPRGHR